MDNPHEQIGRLQQIQMQIARVIDEYHAQSENEKIIHHLKRAFTELNTAKGVILDDATEAGTMRRIDRPESE